MTKQQILALYRLFFTTTRHCPDRSLKLYIRRRARQDFASLKTRPINEVEPETARLKADLQVIRRQMAIRLLYVL